MTALKESVFGILGEGSHFKELCRPGQHIPISVRHSLTERKESPNDAQVANQPQTCLAYLALPIALDLNAQGSTRLSIVQKINSGDDDLGLHWQHEPVRKLS